MPKDSENSPKGKKNNSLKKILKPEKKVTDKLSKVEPEPKIIDPEIQKLIQQAFNQFYDTVSVENVKKADIAHLHNINREYLKCYITVGYDLTDNRVFLMHAENTKDKDALMENFRFAFFNIMNNQAGDMNDMSGDCDEM
jgi:hypothetical protein